MINRPVDFGKKLWIVLADASSSFRRNNDLTAASSLAFSATLALIPVLFLLTVLIGAAVGSSARAVQKTQELMTQLIPAYSQVILAEVNFIARHKGTIGLLNLFVLFWSITPLVADMRVCLGRIFRKKPSRPFFLEKLFDAAIGVIFLIGLAAVAVAGIVVKVMDRIRPFRFAPGYLEDFALFSVVTAVVLALYFTFSKRVRFRHLLAGSLATALLWFAVRPGFHLFLTYNPGYGFAFGSLKSLFVVIIWIYLSLALFLFGAEIAACLGRDEIVHIKHLMEGRKNVPADIVRQYVVKHAAGSVIFKDGDPGKEMYRVLKGRVSIMKDGRKIADVPEGKMLGALSFLLSSPRTTTAVALDDVELVVLNNQNIDNLMNEFPSLVVEMVREMAVRLRETNGATD
jgi:membrane protein